MRLYLKELNTITGYIEFEDTSYDKVYLIYKYLSYKRSQYEKLFNTTNDPKNSLLIFELIAKFSSQKYFLYLLNRDNIQFIYVPLKLEELLQFDY
jgi:hypothetical protein